jgi:hypothetical protein
VDLDVRRKVNAWDWSRAGKYLLLRNENEVWYYSPSENKSRTYIQEKWPARNAQFSPDGKYVALPRTRVAGRRCASPRFPMRPAGGRSPTTVAKDRVGVLTARNCTFLLPKAVARCQRKSRFLTPELKQKTPRPGSRPRSFPLEIVRQSWSLRPTTDHLCRRDPLALTPPRDTLRPPLPSGWSQSGRYDNRGRGLHLPSAGSWRTAGQSP